MTTILVRGSGDVGSAVASILFKAGHRVVLHDAPAPSHSRRGMAFVDALFQGTATLEGLLAKRARSLNTLPFMLKCRRAVPVSDAPLQDVVAEVHPQVLVDARMRKHDQPEAQRGLAPLTIGLGPNFDAGGNVDIAIETKWGDELGAVIRAVPPVRSPENRNLSRDMPVSAMFTRPRQEPSLHASISVMRSLKGKSWPALVKPRFMHRCQVVFVGLRMTGSW